MDQTDLKQLEQRCIQEEPPECIASCPLHVDTRAFVHHVREGRWREAWQTLTRTMPLAGLIGRICDAPCQERCKRREAGDAVRIGALERACVGQGRHDYAFTPLPSKGKQVAICGSGLSSLTAAWDMIRKSYGVTVFEAGERPGADLLTRHTPILSGPIIDAELAVLEKWGVRFETGAPLQSHDFLRQIHEQCDALYIGLDSVDSPRGRCPATGTDRCKSTHSCTPPAIQRSSPADGRHRPSCKARRDAGPPPPWTAACRRFP